jgi:hypothetical protein
LYCTKYYWGNQIKEDDICKTGSIYVCDENADKIYVGKLRRRDHLEYVNIAGTIKVRLLRCEGGRWLQVTQSQAHLPVLVSVVMKVRIQTTSVGFLPVERH